MSSVDNDWKQKMLIALGYQNPKMVNGKPQGTVFGVDMVVGNEHAAVATKWDMGIPLKAFQFDITGTAYLQCTTTEETIEFGTGTDSDGEIKVWSTQRIRYEPGTPLFQKFTAAFPKLADSNGDYTCAIGLYDTDNGYLYGQRRRNGVLEYGFIVVRDSVEEWYPANGVDYPIDHDPNNLLIYRIDAGYLGIAPTNVYVSDSTKEIWRRIHRQTYPQRITSIKTPDLPIGAFIRNEGNTLDIKVLNGSVQGGTINGKQDNDPSARTKTYRLTQTIPSSAVDEPIVAFSNPITVDMYDRIDISGIPRTRLYTNTIASQLLQIQGVFDGQNKSGTVDLYAVPVADVISGTFTPVDLGYSILQVSSDPVIDLTDAELLESFSFGSVADIPLTMVETLDLLFPGQVAVFVVTSSSVSFDVTWTIKYQDRF
jgi:hypothetical protein